MTEKTVKRKKMLSQRESWSQIPSLENRIRRTSDTVKRKNLHTKTGGNRNNKGADFSTRDVTVLFQVVHEMLRRVGPHRHSVQFLIPSGEIYHVLLVGAPAVKPAALTQDAYKLGRVGGGNPAAIRQNIHMLIHADNFLVLSL